MKRAWTLTKAYAAAILLDIWFAACLAYALIARPKGGDYD